MVGSAGATVGLQQELADELMRKGMIRSPEVEAAFRAVPRHLFVAGAAGESEAYRDEVIELIPGLSTASQPSVVAMMLEELGVRRRQRVLEIGTASGYNAALLAELAGDPRLVYTVEIEEQLSESARAALSAAGYGEVNVLHGDGMGGFPSGAPFDRAIITAAVSGLSNALVSQMSSDGLIVMPWAVPGLPEVVLRLQCGVESDPKVLSGDFVGFPVTFVPMRGGSHAGWARQNREARRLTQALGMAREQVWAAGWAFGTESQIALGLYLASAIRRAAEEDLEVVLGLGLDAWTRDDRPELTDLSVLASPVGVESPYVERLPGAEYIFSFGPADCRGRLRGAQF